MKKLLICLLLLPSLAWGQEYARMNPYILGGGASAAVDGPNAWYFSCTATPAVEPTWNNNGGVTTNYAACSKVTITTGGSITKVAFDRSDTDSANVKLAIYTTGGSYKSGTCTLSGVTANGWNECTLGASVAVSSNEEIYVCLDTDTAGVNVIMLDTIVSYYAASTYANFPEASYTLSEYASHCWGFKVYVD